MLDRTIYFCGMCQRRYFYYRRQIVILRIKECGSCRYKQTCPYFKVKAEKGLDPECFRKAKNCGLKRI
jgi:hypothetical protein